MISPEKERICIEELTLYADKVLDNAVQSKIPVPVDYSPPSKEISPIKEKKSVNDSLKYS